MYTKTLLIILFLSQLTLGDDLSRAAYKVFKENCHSCHGVAFKVEGLNVLDYGVMTASADSETDTMPYVAAGDLDNSKIWQFVDGGIMPPTGDLDKESKEAIKAWIEGGAPAFDFEAVQVRDPISLSETLDAIDRHLRRENREDRQFRRYFTLRHLWNDPSITDPQLRIFRAGLVKALNSLCRESEIIQPDKVDDNGTIFSIDLRDFGWDRAGLWNRVVTGYPYGLKPTSVNDQIDRRTSELYDEIAEQIGPEIRDVVAIRADWFAAKSMQSPRYDEFLNLPDNLDELEESLGIDRAGDFKRNRLRRAGFAQSGISRQSRLVDRHSGNTGGYWISYDFLSSSGKSNPIRFPLGPNFPGHPHPNQAFEQAGSEIIFPLENKLHGYMIVKEDGEKITEAPIKIVADTSEFSGSPVIVNGISCIGCHRTGLRDFEDTIRETFSINNNRVLTRVEKIFGQQGEMRRLVDRDRRTYLSALQSAVGPYLQVAEDSDKSIDEFPEPVSALVRFYHSDVPRERLAHELGVDPDDISANITNSLADLGLGPLKKGVNGVVDRFAIEATDGGNSVFQQAASALRLGIPLDLR